LATRPPAEPRPEDYGQLLAAPTTQRLALGTLSCEETVALVCQRLGVTTVPEPVAALIWEKAEGHFSVRN
ncbi:MAG: hypothetical protein V3S24_18345, partial [Candidatus Tectomicrobia bacterium]